MRSLADLLLAEKMKLPMTEQEREKLDIYLDKLDDEREAAKSREIPDPFDSHDDGACLE